MEGGVAVVDRWNSRRCGRRWGCSVVVGGGVVVVDRWNSRSSGRRWGCCVVVDRGVVIVDRSVVAVCQMAEQEL